MVAAASRELGGRLEACPDSSTSEHSIAPVDHDLSVNGVIVQLRGPKAFLRGRLRDGGQLLKGCLVGILLNVAQAYPDLGAHSWCGMGRQPVNGT